MSAGGPGIVARLKALSPALIAVSGGVDSRLLVRLAGLTALYRKGRFAAVHIRGPHVPPADTLRAEAICHGFKLPLTILDFDPLSLPQVRANTRERCYHCKHALFSRIQTLAEELGRPGAPFTVLDGSTASDSQGWRPGLRALAELGVHSPLSELGLDKAAVRRLSRELSDPDWDQPARPCLLTRFAYDLPLDSDLLPLLLQGEELLTAAGLREFRLRVPALGRLELHLEQKELPLWEERAPQLRPELLALGLPEFTVRGVATVSGWYDRRPLPAGAEREAAPPACGGKTGEEPDSPL